MPTKPQDMLPGARYRATHQASVDAILGPMHVKRKVTSAGSEFVNVDNWYIRMLAGNFCKWHATKPSTFDGKVARDLMLASNTDKVDDPHIRIAETPDHLPMKVATALIGAAYHESWHTKYSHRSHLSIGFISDVFAKRFDKANWMDLEEHLLSWMNLVEDIRIERLGCSDFVGAYERMADLQDFVLEKEAEHWAEDPPDSTSVLFGVFRDLGHAYDTDAVKRVLEFYEKTDPVAYQLVTAGPLKPYFDKAVCMGPNDSKMCLPLAMDILIELTNLSKSPEPKVSKIAKSALKPTTGFRIMLDASKALREVLESIFGVKAKSRRGAEIFRPYTTNFDRLINVVQQKYGSLNVSKLHKDVRSQTNYLRTRLRHLFRATELVDVEHGLRRGKHISNRMIAESVALTRLHVVPDRPFYDVSEAPDLSMAAVVVVDESASMQSALEDTCRILLCLTESLDSIGCKTAVAGFMKTDPSELYRTLTDPIDQDKYHRTHAMNYHLFKNFDERFANIKDRFGALNAAGDTPMGDGLNFAINLLSPRTEGHRFIFLVTDGQPDDHGPLNNRLVVAASVGIKVIGVGLGTDARYVPETFPDSVYADDLPAIPPLLVRKITTIVERNESKRGRRISKDQEVR